MESKDDIDLHWIKLHLLSKTCQGHFSIFLPFEMSFHIL